MSPSTGRGPTAAKVGPNAIIRVAEALEQACGTDVVGRVFRAADLEPYLTTLPTEMVKEQEVSRLQSALREQLGLALARSVSMDAGLRTGDYLLANRIPRPVQRLLTFLPARLASRILISAIRRNAWTFVGSGVFDGTPGRPTRLTVTDGPICRGAEASEPICDFYAGSFERLFSKLVHKNARVTEIACQAGGAESCVFEVRW
ncbi:MULTISPECIES: bacteriochlorophyll 4-vinyl reductase [unclassified Thiocapsa]|uniref:bacteriochlorophyll 4-vinyl reductase n=1 Tax=unclassified Thiocapsa TaxID=2641286 RepID=UPI0035B353AE